MAKKGLLGKLMTAVVAGAAIGGTCYVFRDKIKASKLYEDLDVESRLTQLKSLFKKDEDNEDEDDFIDEDEYIFSDADTGSTDRTYVSIDTGHESAGVAEDEEDDEDTVPTISLETIEGTDETSTTEDTASPAPDETAASDVAETERGAASNSDIPTGYDMEGLSDVSEDPDVLIEQDMLDEAPFEF